jgi:threonine/homoserine/homoserine lactone efflux protein
MAEGLRWEGVGAFVVTALLIMGSPGPATISLVAAGSTYGLRATRGYLVGIIVGTAMVLAAVAAGITVVLLTVPLLGSLLLGVSLVYIVWLAYHLATAPPLSERRPGAAPSLAGGLLLGVANPKAWLAIGAVYASARLVETAVVDAVVKTVVLTGLIVAINTVWLLAGASLASWLRSARWARVVNGAQAIMLLGAAVVTAMHQLGG